MADSGVYGVVEGYHIDSFELRNGKLYLYGSGFADGCLILRLFQITCIQQISAGTELTLDDGATRLILSNQFEETAVAAIWRWYGNRDESVKCSRQTLRSRAVQPELPKEPSLKGITKPEGEET